MKLTRTLLLALAVLLGGTAASAQTTDVVTLTSTGSVTAFNYYVGPYQGTFGSQPGMAAIDMYCVDFLHSVSAGQTWDANITWLDFGADMSNTRGGVGSLDLYRQAAWLTTQFRPDNHNEWGDIHASIWLLFTGAGPVPSSNNWLTLASQNYETTTADFDFRSFAVITTVNPSDPGSIQELVARVPPNTVTPEPSTYLLLGSGLLSMLLVTFLKRTA